MGIKIKRIYDMPSIDDGKRILIDRLWPRGVSKERAMVDIWLKDAAPSSELRKWYGHSPARHEEFRKLYEAELLSDSVHGEAVEFLRSMSLEGEITLLYAAKDKVYNHAVILLDWIRNN